MQSDDQEMLGDQCSVQHYTAAYRFDLPNAVTLRMVRERFLTSHFAAALTFATLYAQHKFFTMQLVSTSRTEHCRLFLQLDGPFRVFSLFEKLWHIFRSAAIDAPIQQIILFKTVIGRGLHQ
jgi:hypothetical protein